MVKENFSTRGLVHDNWNHTQGDLARAIIIRLYPELGDNHYEA